jgi:hypothetical protein
LKKLRIVVVIGIAALLVIAGAVIFAGGPELRGAALRELPTLFPEDNKKLGGIVITSYREFRGNAVRWSGAYFGCLFGSAFLSALAALALKLDLLQRWPGVRNDAAAAAAVLAALLITLSTTGDFQRKWQANRIAAAAMENLAYELIKPHTAAQLESVVERIQAINEARNRGIVGEMGEGRPPGADAREAVGR